MKQRPRREVQSVGKKRTWCWVLVSGCSASVDALRRRLECTQKRPSNAAFDGRCSPMHVWCMLDAISCRADDVHGRCKLFDRTTLRCGDCLGLLAQVIVHQTGPDRLCFASCNAGRRLCQALTSNILARGAVALPGVVAFTPCYCVVSSILVGLGFVHMLCFNSLSRGMPDSIIE